MVCFTWASAVLAESSLTQRFLLEDHRSWWFPLPVNRRPVTGSTHVPMSCFPLHLFDSFTWSILHHEPWNSIILPFLPRALRVQIPSGLHRLANRSYCCSWGNPPGFRRVGKWSCAKGHDHSVLLGIGNMIRSLRAERKEPKGAIRRRELETLSLKWVSFDLICISFQVVSNWYLHPYSNNALRNSSSTHTTSISWETGRCETLHLGRELEL